MSPDDMLAAMLRYGPAGGTNFDAALSLTETIMAQHWNSARSPVVIFLSDGECGVNHEVMENLTRRSIAMGKSLSFHAVSFGPYIEVLQQMVAIANEVEQAAPQDPLNPHLPSSFNQAIDTVQLAQTFLGIEESLRKRRGALLRS